MITNKTIFVAVSIAYISLGPWAYDYAFAPRDIPVSINHSGNVTITCGEGPRVLVVGNSVAAGWGAPSINHEWWVIACQIIGGTWRNVAKPAARVSDEIDQIKNNYTFSADRIIAINGGSDLIVGLAPQIDGQIQKRVSGYRHDVDKLRKLHPNMIIILQPLDLSGAHPLINTVGYEEKLRAAYSEIALEVDIDLSSLNVDYIDSAHFGKNGHKSLAFAIAEAW